MTARPLRPRRARQQKANGLAAASTAGSETLVAGGSPRPASDLSEPSRAILEGSSHDHRGVVTFWSLPDRTNTHQPFVQPQGVTDGQLRIRFQAAVADVGSGVAGGNHDEIPPHASQGVVVCQN